MEVDTNESAISNMASSDFTESLENRITIRDSQQIIAKIPNV